MCGWGQRPSGLQARLPRGRWPMICHGTVPATPRSLTFHLKSRQRHVCDFFMTLVLCSTALSQPLNNAEDGRFEEEAPGNPDAVPEQKLSADPGPGSVPGNGSPRCLLAQLSSQRTPACLIARREGGTTFGARIQTEFLSFCQRRVVSFLWAQKKTDWRVH